MAVCPSVLIVDDDAGVIMTFSEILRREGFDVRTANSAEEGLWEATARGADAIILDLRMQDSGGLDVLRRLRSDPRHRSTPVAIVTGDCMIEEGDIEAIGQLGAKVHYKPMWLEDLIALAYELMPSGQHGRPVKRPFPQAATRHRHRIATKRDAR